MLRVSLGSLRAYLLRLFAHVVRRRVVRPEHHLGLVVPGRVELFFPPPLDELGWIDVRGHVHVPYEPRPDEHPFELIAFLLQRLLRRHPLRVLQHAVHPVVHVHQRSPRGHVVPRLDHHEMPHERLDEAEQRPLLALELLERRFLQWSVPAVVTLHRARHPDVSGARPVAPRTLKTRGRKPVGFPRC